MIFYGEKLAEIKIKENGEEYILQLSTDVESLDIPNDKKVDLETAIHETLKKNIEAERSINIFTQFFANLFRLAAATQTGVLPPIYSGATFSTSMYAPSAQHLYGVLKRGDVVYFGFILYYMGNYPFVITRKYVEAGNVTNAIFMDFASRRPTDEINRFLSEATKMGMKGEIVKKLKLGNKQIVSLDLVAEDGKVVPLIQYSWLNQAIPLELSGDGIKTILAILLASNIMENHYILLEEPENHLHPKLIDLLSTLIKEQALKGVKYVIVTHSIEIVKKILEKTAEEDIDVNLYYFKRKENGEIKATKYSKGDAKLKIVELGIDLRRE
ncbi:MAG: AAA family ATPase [Candidatus Njordarchaeia archaeon]